MKQFFTIFFAILAAVAVVGYIVWLKQEERHYRNLMHDSKRLHKQVQWDRP